MDPPSAMILVSQCAITANEVISEWTKTERACINTQMRAEQRLRSLETMPRQFRLDPFVQALESQLKNQINELKAFSAMHALKKPFNNSNAQEVEEQAERTMQHLLHEVILCSIKESAVIGRSSEEYNRLSQFSRQPTDVSRSSVDDRNYIATIEDTLWHGPTKYRSRVIEHVSRLAARDHRNVRQHFVSSRTLGVLVSCLEDPALADQALGALRSLADALGFANRDTTRDLVSGLNLLLRNGSIHAQVGASVVICKMASNASVRQIVLDSEAPRFLLTLTSATSPSQRENALQALFHLAPDIQSDLIDPVFLSRFVELLGTTDARHKREAAACAGIISVLADNADHHEQLEDTKVIQPLKRFVEWHDNELGQTHALSALYKLANSPWLRNVITDHEFLHALVQQLYHSNGAVRKLAEALLLRLASADQSRASFSSIMDTLLSLIKSKTAEHQAIALRIMEQAACDSNIAGKIANNSKATRELFDLLATSENAVIRVHSANILLVLVRAERCYDQITSHAMPSLLDMASSTDPDERETALAIVLGLAGSANARRKLREDAHWTATLEQIQWTSNETQRRTAREILKQLGATLEPGEREKTRSWRDVFCGCFSHREKRNASAREKEEKAGGSISSTRQQLTVTPTSDFSQL